jgi:hypothetical protein
MKQNQWKALMLPGAALALAAGERGDATGVAYCSECNAPFASTDATALCDGCRRETEEADSYEYRNQQEAERQG